MLWLRYGYQPTARGQAFEQYHFASDRKQDLKSIVFCRINTKTSSCQIRYMPRMSNYRGRTKEIPFDFPELLGALAPRPFFVHAPLRDGNFRWKSVDVCATAARPIYKLLGNENGLIIKHPDYDHNFPKDMREGAYATIDSVLRPQIN